MTFPASVKFQDKEFSPRNQHEMRDKKEKKPIPPTDGWV
jgi:hypothetical protein